MRGFEIIKNAKITKPSQLLIIVDDIPCSPVKCPVCYRHVRFKAIENMQTSQLGFICSECKAVIFSKVNRISDWDVL